VKLHLVSAAVLAASLTFPLAAHAQGVPDGVSHGAYVGAQAAGPVGGLVGGVVGGVIGGVDGALGIRPAAYSPGVPVYRHHYRRHHVYRRIRHAHTG